MAKKRRIKVKQAILSRQLNVRSVGLYVSRYVERPRGSPAVFAGGPWIDLRGTIDEPIRDCREVALSVHIDDLETPSPDSPLSVGAIIQFRPHIVPVVRLPTADFDRVWTLAASGQLHYAGMAFTERYRSSARVVNVSFSNESE